MNPQRQRTREGILFLFFCAHYSGRQLADRPCRNHLRAERTMSRAGRSWFDGSFGRHHGRHCAGFARFGAAASRYRDISAGGSLRQRSFGLVRTHLAGGGFGDRFFLSEFADLTVYTPLARRRLVMAVIASSCAGVIVDSIAFLWLAFGSLDFLAGQVVGKAWMVLLSMPLVAWLRRRDERLGIVPA